MRGMRCVKGNGRSQCCVMTQALSSVAPEHQHGQYKLIQYLLRLWSSCVLRELQASGGHVCPSTAATVMSPQRM